MAEEAATPAAPAPVTEEATTEKKSDNNKGKNRRKKEDDVPIEELYDLSKPIPRVSFLTRKMTADNANAKSEILGGRPRETDRCPGFLRQNNSGCLVQKRGRVLSNDGAEWIEILFLRHWRFVGSIRSVLPYPYRCVAAFGRFEPLRRL